MARCENEILMFRSIPEEKVEVISIPTKHFKMDAVKTIINHSINSTDSRCIAGIKDDKACLIKTDELESIKGFSKRNQAIAINQIASNLKEYDAIFIRKADTTVKSC